MIDTVKIYTSISKEIYLQIYNNSIVKSSINKGTGELMYEIVNDHLEGTYSSSLSVRVGCSVKYHLFLEDYYIEIEGSYHKIWKGFNSHGGIYNLEFIVKGFIELAENSYNIKLPQYDKWYLQRIDIAKCFDIDSQKNVTEYINSLGNCKYSRRKLKYFANESIYVSGTTNTLKIYNKMLEFRKHDESKFKNLNFDFVKYYDTIQGYIRFEIEIKKKSLQKILGREEKHISVLSLKYEDFEKMWESEFMKLLGIMEKELEIVRGKEDVKQRLIFIYGQTKGMRLYNFYSSVQLDGIDFVKKDMASRTFYRNIKELKEARVDYSQMYELHEKPSYWFNPFEMEEVV